MNNLFFLITHAIAHSGGTDAYGCHSGSKSHHCHEQKTTLINFDDLLIEGENIKPSLRLVNEVKKANPCADIDPTTNEHVECQINLSFREISKICKDLSSGDQSIKPFLEYLIDLSLRKKIVENTDEGNWIYKRREGSFIIEHSPNGKYNGLKVEDVEANYSIKTLENNQILSELKMYSHSFYEDPQHVYQIWNSCLTDGEKSTAPQIVTRTGSEISLEIDMQEVPTPLSACKSFESTTTIDPKNKRNVCVGGWDWENMYMPGTQFNLDRDYWDVNSSLYNDNLVFNDKGLKSTKSDGIKYYPISNSMIIVKNYDKISNNSTYGILYRKIAIDNIEEFVNRKLIFLTLDRETREQYLQVYKKEYQKEFILISESKFKFRKNIRSNLRFRDKLVGIKTPQKLLLVTTAIAAATTVVVISFLKADNRMDKNNVEFHSFLPICWSSVKGDVHRYECL